MSNGLGPQKLSTQRKQSTQMVPVSSSPGPQQSSVSNSQTEMMAPTFGNPGPQNLSVPNKRPTQVISMPNIVGPHHNKRNSPMEPSPKGQSESSDSVRGKLRESLAASLALVCKPQSKAEGNNSPSEAASTLTPDNENTHLAKSISTSVDVGSCRIPEKPENLSFKDDKCAPKVSNWQSSSQEISVNDHTGVATQTMISDGQDFQLNYVLPDERVLFKDNILVKDEFLQGNGLCWASDLNIEVSEEKESLAKRPKVVHEVGRDGDGQSPQSPTALARDGDGQSPQSPTALATRIEAELFKLFGGVNKKYKEKGRSLLFNLKDRSNPELRERVMSGEIPPDRLCSMTAEELASKELSRWRIAKAEELAQMVVLPDSDVNNRRLVKKTHKGEFQVEFDQDDGVSVEVAPEASSLSQYRPKTNEKDAQVLSKPNDSVTSEIPIHETDSHGQNLQNSLITLPNDSSDLLDGLVVDEMKDAESLPPIVSLDEFMESLDSEPPFEDLPVDAGTMLKPDENTNFEGDSKFGSTDLCSVNLLDTSPNKPDEIDTKSTRTETNGTVKSILIEKELEISSPGSAPKQDYVWEGLLQLNVAAIVTVNGYFKSGEKTSVNEWPNLLDVKGRVRLDAFDKFLQELPMSKSRAIMILHFCWKEGSSESGRMNLCEVTESYIVDERVGFAEPVAGVELYLCPPHSRTSEMLGKNLPKGHTETLNAVNDGLIGIVVWRKPHIISTKSPKSSSHSKHSSKKQHSSLRRQQEAHTSATPILPLPITQRPTNPEPPVDDDPIDDVPPGFGPAAAAAADEDDLPEFDFVGGSNLPVSHPSASKPGMAPTQPIVQAPPRPVEEMRELIHRYGHGATNSNRGNWPNRGAGIEIQPWNDDDDIPEWQPQPQPQLQPPPPPPPLLPPPPPPPPPPPQMPPQPQQHQMAPQTQQQMPPQPSHTPMAPQLMNNYIQQLNPPPHIVNQQHFVSMPTQVPMPMPMQVQMQMQQMPVQMQMQMPVQMQQMPMQMVSQQQLQVQYPAQPLMQQHPMVIQQPMMIQPGQQWQQGTCWTLQHGQSVDGNGLMIQPPCNNAGGQPPFQVQYQDTPTPTGFGASQNGGGMDWRPDPSRSRKF